MAKRKKTDEAVQRIFEALKTWMDRTSACAFAKTPRSTFYEWMKDKKFRTEIEIMEDLRVVTVHQEKQKLIEKWYRPAIEKELEAKRRDEYGKKVWLDWWTDGEPVKQSITIKIKK